MSRLFFDLLFVSDNFVSLSGHFLFFIADDPSFFKFIFSTAILAQLTLNMSSLFGHPLNVIEIEPSYQEKDPLFVSVIHWCSIIHCIESDFNVLSGQFI